MSYYIAMNRVAIIAIFIVGLIVRVWWLGEIPGGLNHDQTDVILIARSFLTKGEDPKGNKLPVALVKRQIEMGDDTLLSLFFVPTEAMELGLFGARFPLVVVNIISALLVGLLARNLHFGRRTSILAMGVFWISPWSIAFTRGDVQAPLAVMQLLIAINLLLRKKRGFLLFCSLTWMCYYGFRPLLIILVPALTILRAKYKMTTLGGWIMVVFIYILIVSNISNSTLHNRLSESNLGNLQRYATEVKSLRQSSVNSLFTPLFINKYTLLMRDLGKNYLSSFGTDFLVWHGDERAVYRFENHGVMYFVELPLIVSGLIAGTNPTVWLLMILAPIGSVLSSSETSHIYRSSLLLPMLVILIAAGINKLWRFKWLFGIGYGVFFTRFLMFYFLQYPVLAGELTGVGERVVVNYLARSTDVCLSAQFQSKILQQYELYFRKDFSNSESCITKLVQKEVDPKTQSHDLEIQNERDSGVSWRVYNDQLCKRYSLDPWRRFHFVSDYSIEEMTNEQFCQRWMHSPIN
jgi:hypothetical protein